VASVLGSLLASQARKALAQKLPLDVLSIAAGEEGITDARLEVGKYLTDDLYLGYNGRLGATSSSGATPTTARTTTRCAWSTRLAPAGAWRPSTAMPRGAARTSSGARSIRLQAHGALGQARVVP
jgi:hypothetical protein